MFEKYDAADDHAFTSDSRFSATLAWFCSTSGLKEAALGCFMGQIIQEKRLNAFIHMLSHHTVFSQADIDVMINVSEHHGLPEMSDRLQAQNPATATEAIVWRCGFWNWIDL